MVLARCNGVAVCNVITYALDSFRERTTIRALLTLPLIFVSSFALAEDSKHLTAKDGVEVLHAWAPATSHDHARIYMEIANEGATDVVLVEASSDIADEIVLVALTTPPMAPKRKRSALFRSRRIPRLT